jgi:hypothetical protein
MLWRPCSRHVIVRFEVTSLHQYRVFDLSEMMAFAQSSETCRLWRRIPANQPFAEPVRYLPRPDVNPAARSWRTAASLDGRRRPRQGDPRSASVRGQRAGPARRVRNPVLCHDHRPHRPRRLPPRRRALRGRRQRRGACRVGGLRIRVRPAFPVPNVAEHIADRPRKSAELHAPDPRPQAARQFDFVPLSRDRKASGVRPGSRCLC